MDRMLDIHVYLLRFDAWICATTESTWNYRLQFLSYTLHNNQCIIESSQ